LIQGQHARESVWVSADFPSLKVTVPVGVPEPGEFALTPGKTGRFAFKDGH
jgi:hypothetical protein